MLRGYEGYLRADAYSGYDALYASGKILEVGCWMHARRKFYEARITNLPRVHQHGRTLYDSAQRASVRHIAGDVTDARNRRVDKRLIHSSATRTRTASEIRLNPFAFGFVTAVRQRPITEP